MSKLWQKKEGAQPHPAVNRYIVGNELTADNKLVRFDVQASIAHAQMLKDTGLLKATEADQIIVQLQRIVKLHEDGKFVLQQENEDVHTEIENFLVQELGDIGKRIHLGRSRNDQVLVATRLYCLDQIRVTQSKVLALAQAILKFAKTHEFVPMAGFTHMQHAMPSSVGQWAAAFVESLICDFDILKSAYAINDQNPLGSAAGFGTSVPIDREQTTRLLGFSKPQINSIFCQNSRAKFDAYSASCLTQVMLTLGKIANDVVVFNSYEFRFFDVDPQLTTGSSIMPQKRNLDIMEVLRANVSVVQSLQFQIQTVGLNLISGYNKDIKVVKQALIECFEIVNNSLEIVGLLFNHLTPNTVGLLRSFEDLEIFATDVANDLVTGGMPFRDAYRQVGENLSKLEKQNPLENIRAKRHLGAPGNLALDLYQQQISQRLAAS